MRALWMSCLLIVAATPAAAACLDTVESSMRKSLADSVRHTLFLLDRDDALAAQWFDQTRRRSGGMGLAGTRFGERAFCGADGAAAAEQVLFFYGAEAHSRAPDGLSVRALVFGNSVDGVGSRAGGQHAAFGALVGYGPSIELGLLRFVQTGDAVESADGWLVSAASHGIRSTLLLGDDSLDVIRLGIDPLPLGPLELGGSVRYVRDEGRAVAEVLVQRLGLTGGAREWLFLDLSAQLETSVRAFRSATAELYIWAATTPADVEALPEAPMRGTLDVRVMTSIYAGDRLPANEALPGFGIGVAVGMVGRYGGLYLDLMGWGNDPAVMDNAVDPYNAHRTVASIVFRIDG